jgi:hypothetical protein
MMSALFTVLNAIHRKFHPRTETSDRPADIPLFSESVLFALPASFGEKVHRFIRGIMLDKFRMARKAMYNTTQ